ncbi:hypothetical protein [Tenacibaculum finnmarkense]|uniref:hypothetical protein n=1 Tax=Tenacibaculum finnmarkense TaxID=2781243 RepID=UPI001EFAFDA1|nr:hypothetical protein [Tenacibaculum finnmarkense]MCG8796699.1 hypothetical protein [Tenacibaculum finnmarkense]MCG8798998.1 hypothetical protein [Tenacibaculum finnmarkense]
MNNEIKQKSDFFSELINKNYNQLKELYSHSFMEFSELNKLKIEILNCQLFELYQSSIFSTNHFMERMIKLALIKLHTIEFDFSDIEKYSEKLKESEKEYDKLVLFKSLEKALKKELITTKQYNYLINAKNNFRNPYSHAEVSKIIKNDNDFTGFMFDISDVQNKLKEGKILDIPNPTIIPKFSPGIAQLLQENNSKEKAFEYFENVFKILKEIEKKITELKNKKH